jgi:regulator of ribosome biosynthesis
LSLSANLDEYLQSTARDGIQTLVAALYALPIHPSPDGPLVQLPPPTTPLPRAKPLPKPKPPTKWERFAAAKGIQKKRRDKKTWDEEKQEWVHRWGRDGKNKEKEDQWIHEVKKDARVYLFFFFFFCLSFFSLLGHGGTETLAAVDVDPVQDARNARKSRVAKNERQKLQNSARAQAAREEREQRQVDIDQTLASTRISTASLGKFDKKLEGDKKMRGVKRKVGWDSLGWVLFVLRESCRV